MTITVITPTANRPTGIALAERMMARQTRQPDQWIVSNGGMEKLRLTCGQEQLWTPNPRPGLDNFLYNLARAEDVVTGDLVVIWEDDDWYAPTHLEAIERHLSNPFTDLVGDNTQRYYHVGARAYLSWSSPMPSLCQMAFRRALLPQLHRALVEAGLQQRIDVDRLLWTSIDGAHSHFGRDQTVVNLKGVPGQVGLGIGHRPTTLWSDDRDLSTLRSWIGDDVEWYRAFGEVAA